MPIHDLGYERFEGARTARRRRSLALARSELLRLWSHRSFLLLLAACWIPAVVRAAQIYVARQFPRAAELVTVDASLWREFLGQQVEYLPVLLVALYAGAGAVASDLRSGAVVIYLSKPISVLDYVLGKSLPVAGAIASITLVPALALVGLQVALSGDWGVLERSPWLPLAIAGYSVSVTLYFTLAVLAVSSLSRSGRVAGIGFVALALGTETLAYTVLSRLGLSRPPAFLGMRRSVVDAGHLFFGERFRGDGPVLSLAAMAAVVAIAVFVLSRRLRSAEVRS